MSDLAISGIFKCNLGLTTNLDLTILSREPERLIEIRLYIQVIKYPCVSK